MATADDLATKKPEAEEQFYIDANGVKQDSATHDCHYQLPAHLDFNNPETVEFWRKYREDNPDAFDFST